MAQPAGMKLPLRARRASKALSKDERVLAASAATITASISSSALTSSQAPGGRIPSRASSSSIVSRLSRDKGGIVASSSSSVSGISSKLNGNGGGVQGGKENNGINLAPRRVLGDVSNASKGNVNQENRSSKDYGMTNGAGGPLMKPSRSRAPSVSSTHQTQQPGAGAGQPNGALGNARSKADSKAGNSTTARQPLGLRQSAQSLRDGVSKVIGVAPRVRSQSENAGKVTVWSDIDEDGDGEMGQVPTAGGQDNRKSWKVDHTNVQHQHDLLQQEVEILDIDAGGVLDGLGIDLPGAGAGGSGWGLERSDIEVDREIAGGDEGMQVDELLGGHKRRHDEGADEGIGGGSSDEDFVPPIPHQRQPSSNRIEEDPIGEGSLEYYSHTGSSSASSEGEDEDEDGDDWMILDPTEQEVAERKLQEVKEGFKDELDYWDMTMVAEYSEEIFKYMAELENQAMPDPRYMDRQKEIEWSMRSTLIDWLLQVHLRYHMLPETLWIAVNIVDRFLSARVVSLVKLQLVGVTAMFVAAKYEEIMAPSVDEFVFMTENGYSREEILKGETIILQTLNFDISRYCSPYSWVRKISKADDYDIQTRTLSKFLMEVTLLDHRFLRAKPSMIAAIGMYLAKKMLGAEWNERFIFYSNYTEAQLVVPSQFILEVLISSDFDTKFVYRKYSSRKYLKASTYARNWAKEHFQADQNGGMS